MWILEELTTLVCHLLEACALLTRNIVVCGPGDMMPILGHTHKMGAPRLIQILPVIIFILLIKRNCNWFWGQIKILYPINLH